MILRIEKTFFIPPKQYQLKIPVIFVDRCFLCQLSAAFTFSIITSSIPSLMKILGYSAT